MVIFQFAVSIVLIASTAIIYGQLEHMTSQNLGFSIDNVISIPVFGSKSALRQNPESVKTQFLQCNGVVAASAISGWPGGLPGGAVFDVQPDGKSDQDFTAHYIGADESLLSVYQIDLVAGRNLSTLGGIEVLLNETAVRQLGWTDPIGKRWAWRNPIHDAEVRVGTVVGVVKDFHFETMHNRIRPLFVGPHSQLFTLLVRVRPENIPQTVAALRAKWEELVPEKHFAYGFESQHFERRLYQKEKQLTHLAMWASLLAILLACLGLFGLAASEVEHRTKEIGIRKVLSASASRLVLMLSTAFTKLVLVAILIACPIAHFATQHWLQEFAYRIDVGVAPFLTGSALALLVAWIAVGYQTLRAARSNPVDVLRDE